MRSKSTLQLVLNAMFVALVLLLGLTPIGLIPLGAINVTILHIPVIVGSLFLGIKSGLILGCVFGLCSVMSAYGLTLTPPSGLATMLGAKSPVLLILMCMIPRLLVPATAYFSNRLMQRYKLQKHLSLGIAAAVGSVTNTVFYLGLMALFYQVAQLDLNKIATALKIEGLGFWGVIATVATGAGGLEALAAFLLVPPIVAALWQVNNKGQGGNKTP